MEVECKAEKSQEERERTGRPSQPSSLEPTLEMRCNGFPFSSAHNHEARRAAFQDPYTSLTQLCRSEFRYENTEEQDSKKPKTAPGRELGSHEPASATT